MKMFRGFSSGMSSGYDVSILCEECRKKFNSLFKKDEKGKIELDTTENPKPCAACKEKIKQQFFNNKYTDRA